MSDEAFARRFYSDRAELTGLGRAAPLAARRVHGRGALHAPLGELLPRPARARRRRARRAADGALSTSTDKFAYAEPLRLALQNLALGRPGFHDAPTRHRRARSRVSAPDYSPELAGRLSKLETAISKQRTIKFSYWSPQRDGSTRAHAQPVRASARRGRLVRRRARPRPRRDPHVPRLADPQRHPLRDPARARLPPAARVRRRGAPRPAALADRRARRDGADRASRSDTAWWVHRTLADAGVARGRRLRDRRTRRSSRSPAGSCVRTAAPCRSSRRRCATPSRTGSRACAKRHDGDAAGVGARAPRRCRRADRERPSGRADRARAVRASSRRSSRTSSPPAARVATRDSTPTTSPTRFSIPREELQDTLSLLNLVNFGGGCYTVYAEVDEDAGVVRVDKELYGDVFRQPPKLTPLEARAIRLAIEYVGPTIAAEAHTPLDRVRKKLEETFGQFELAQTPAPRVADDEEKLVRTLSDGVEKRRVVEIEYLKEGDEQPTTALVEPYSFERELPVWRVHTWDRTADGPRTYRLDRMRSARLTDETFEPREGFDPRLPERAAARAALALAGRRALEARARRTAAHRQGRHRGAAVQDGGVAALRGARRRRRDRRARAGRHAARRRRPGPGAPVGARASARGGSATGSTSLNVAPGRGVDSSSTAPPCASAIARATPQPEPARAGGPLTPRREDALESPAAMPAPVVGDRDHDDGRRPRSAHVDRRRRRASGRARSRQVASAWRSRVGVAVDDEPPRLGRDDVDSRARAVASSVREPAERRRARAERQRASGSARSRSMSRHRRDARARAARARVVRRRPPAYALGDAPRAPRRGCAARARATPRPVAASITARSAIRASAQAAGVGEHRVVARRVALGERQPSSGLPTLPSAYEGVPPEPARIVPRHVEPVELRDELRPVALQPVDERDVRHGVVRQRHRRRVASRRRDSTGRRPGRCRSRRPTRRARRRYSPASGCGACVQYERQRFASSTPGSSSAPVGQASMQSGSAAVEVERRASPRSRRR